MIQKTEPHYVFQTEMAVRDYECDFQGIVNNANYQHYLEHARHLFMHEFGLDPVKMHLDGVDAVVAHIEIDYRNSLRSGDAFTVKVGVHKKGNIRLIFDQQIIRKVDSKVIIDAEVTCALVRNGRPILPVVIDEAFQKRGLEL